MRYWTAMWDENGIPHYLPEYSKSGVGQKVLVDTEEGELVEGTVIYERKADYKQPEFKVKSNEK
ncbi:hypothetical protein [Bacillus sp. AG4(2022)]|uniref:hypothetical protein n=1 Tax=Bacillus sp. AG4(2022) TaxID=2962594 RepID=UPI0028816577|nr:hypothetical protein [Bacillus sp. AG4(2022)]MDT0160324.1 hypothetical protein [Bacillus sp. AG4(2022)]